MDNDPPVRSGDEVATTEKPIELSERALKIAQHLENRPTVDSLVEHNILKSFRADPSLHEVMQALIRTRRERELGALLKKRRSLQDLIDRNIVVAGPRGSPGVRNARQTLLKHFQRSQLNAFLETRPSPFDVAKLNVLEDTLIWTSLQHAGVIPLSRNGGVLTAIDDGMYLTGGFCADSRRGNSGFETLYYSTVSESWSRPLCAGAIPRDRFAHSCSAVGKQLVVFGGCAIDGNWLNDVHVLDIEFEQPLVPKLEDIRHSWKQLAPQTMFLWYAPETAGAKPCPRAAHSATSVGSRIFVFGGNDGTRLFNDLHILDVETMGWSKPKCRGTPPSPRAGHAAVLVGDHHLYVFGGGTVQGPTNSTHILDLETLTWSEPTIDGTPPAARLGHSMHCIIGQNPRLLVFGGGTVDKLYDDLHVFNCTTCVWSRPSDSGTVPPARTGHASCLVRDSLSERESLYFFGGASSQGELLGDFYLLDCAFFSINCQPLQSDDTDETSIKPGRDNCPTLNNSPRGEQAANKAWQGKIEVTKAHIEELLSGLKIKLSLAHDNAILKEQQLASALQISFEALRAEIDAVSVFVTSEFGNLLTSAAGTELVQTPSRAQGPIEVGENS